MYRFFVAIRATAEYPSPSISRVKSLNDIKEPTLIKMKFQVVFLKYSPVYLLFQDN